jgi:glutamate/aspartate transport system substrate-binding protein
MKRSGLVVLLFAFAASAFAQDLSGTLAKVKETNRVSVGYQESAIPFSYLDGNQKPVGFAMDLCMLIVDDLRKTLALPKLEVQLVPVTPANRIALLINGTIDMNCAAATNNVERQKQVGFVNTHFLSATRFLYKKSSNLKTIADLKGKSVVSVAGSVNIAQLNRYNTERNHGMTIVSAKDQSEAFLMLETDRVQAYAMDDVQLVVAAARSRTPDAYAVSEEAFSRPEPAGILIRKDDAGFKALADRVTADVFRSPQIEQLYTKWFMSPVPPNGLNFNFPMPRVIRNAYRSPSSSPDPETYAQ